MSEWAKAARSPTCFSSQFSIFTPNSKLRHARAARAAPLLSGAILHLFYSFNFQTRTKTGWELPAGSLEVQRHALPGELWLACEARRVGWQPELRVLAITVLYRNKKPHNFSL